MSLWLIQQNRCVLAKNGEYPRIRNKLLQEGILTTDEDEDITAERTRHDQMTKFVDILCRKPGDVIEKCCEAIREADANLYKQLQWPIPPNPDRVHQSERDGQISGDLGKIQKELKSWYTEQLSRYHPIPWCDWLEMDFDHVYTNLKIVPGRKNQWSFRDHPESMKNAETIEDLSECLFSRDDRTITFIQGSAGMGKSTLCRRLVHLWATQNYCIHGHHFDLVLLAEARSVVGDNLKRSMYEQLFSEDCDLTEDTVYKCISRCQEKCLLIIDGVDELTQEGRRGVLQLLEGRFLRRANIILIGRPESVQDFIKYANVHLEVTGFTERNVKSYIRKYFGDDKKELQDTLLSQLGRCLYGDGLRKLSANPFTTLLLCLLVEEKGCNIPSNVNDILEEVITLTLKRYMRKIGPSKNVTTSDLLNCAAQIAYMGFNEEKATFEEKRIKELYPSGVGDHVLMSGLLNRDFTMSKLHTVGYCYFPHKSIQDYLSAKYLANIPQESLDDILMKLKLEDIWRRLDVFEMVLWLLKVQKTRLQKSVLCILDKCPVYKKLKPGFERYVGRLTSERRGPRGSIGLPLRLYCRSVIRLIRVCEECEDACLRVISENGAVLRLLMCFADIGYRGLQNGVALPCVSEISNSFDGYNYLDDLLDIWNHGVLGKVFRRFDLSWRSKFYSVKHKMSHMYTDQKFPSSAREWHHFYSLGDIYLYIIHKPTRWPSALSLLILPGDDSTDYVIEVIDTFNSVKTKLTLFLILPQLQSEDLCRMKLLALFMSQLNDNVQVRFECPNVQVSSERLRDENNRMYHNVEMTYTHPVHHMYYNKYCPF